MCVCVCVCACACACACACVCECGVNRRNRSYTDNNILVTTLKLLSVNDQCNLPMINVT